MRLTGRLWKLRAWSTTVTLPAAIVDARLVKKMNSKGSSGPPAAFGSSSRKNSRIAAVRRCSRGHGRKVVRVMPTSRMPTCIKAPRTAPTAGAKMPICVDQQHRPDDDPEVVQQRCRPVEEEAPLGDQDLAQGHRSREQDLGEAHDPEEVDVQRPRGGIESGHHEVRGERGEDEQDDRHDPHHQHRQRQDRPAEVVGRRLAVVPLEAGEDRDEGRGQSARDDDAEEQFRDQERGLERVELVTDPERLAEDPLADQPKEVADERERREEDGSTRHEPMDQVPGGGDGRSRHGRLPPSRPGAAVVASVTLRRTCGATRVREQDMRRARRRGGLVELVGRRRQRLALTSPHNPGLSHVECAVRVILRLPLLPTPRVNFTQALLFVLFDSR